MMPICRSLVQKCCALSDLGASCGRHWDYGHYAEFAPIRLPYLVLLFADLLHVIGYLIMWAPWVLLANAAISGGDGTLPTILRAIVSEALPPNAQGRASAVVTSIAGACSCVAPVVFGAAFVLGSRLGAPWCPFAASALLILVSYWLTRKWLVTPRALELQGDGKLHSLLD